MDLRAAFGDWRRVAAALAALLILTCHAAAVWTVVDRPMHYDENEYLHASWLMAAGKTIYRDFFEDHPPHLFLTLGALLPEGNLESVDVKAWTIRARLFCALCSFVAVGCLSLLAWRMTRDPVATVVAAAIILGSRQIWGRVLHDIRAEAPTLALFWTGVVLLTWSAEVKRSQAVRAGLGIGLMLLAELWNPKWPLEGAIAGIFFLHYLWRLRGERRLIVAALVPALALFAIALAPIFTVTTWSDYVFFNYTLKSQEVHAFTQLPFVTAFFKPGTVWRVTAPQFQWWWLLPAAALVAFTLATRVLRPHDRRLAWFAVALHVSAWVEFRLIYPYPYIWPQYMTMLAMTAALIWALVPSAVAAGIERLRLRGSILHLLCLIAAALLGIIGSAHGGVIMTESDGMRWRLALAAAILCWIPFVASMVLAARNQTAVAGQAAIIALAWTTAAALLTLGQFIATRPRDAYWRSLADLRRRLGPGDTVWITPPRHPIAAHDASYYWYSLHEAVPFAIHYKRSHPSAPLPRIDFGDLPICKGGAKLIEIPPSAPYLDGVCTCVERAYRSGALAATDEFAIFEPGGWPRETAWLRSTDWVWRDLCRNQRIFVNNPSFSALVRRARP